MPNNRNWNQSWEERRTEIDAAITQSLGAERNIDDAFTEVSATTRGWVSGDGIDDADYNTQFRDYYESRLADLERGGALARQENGSFYVNPEYASGEGPGNPGTAENRLAESTTASRTSHGSGDPAAQ